jgi:hypothetical protein
MVARHTLRKQTISGDDAQKLPASTNSRDLWYFVDVYMDDFIPMAITTLQEQLEHDATVVMTGIH